MRHQTVERTFLFAYGIKRQGLQIAPQQLQILAQHDGLRSKHDSTHPIEAVASKAAALG